MINTYNLDMRHAPFNYRYLHRLSGVIFQCGCMTSTNNGHPELIFTYLIHKDNEDSLSCIVDINQGLMYRLLRRWMPLFQAFLKHKAQTGIRTVPPGFFRYAWVKETGLESVINRTGTLCCLLIKIHLKDQR